ncbi:chromate transporter, partial [Acinetobacter sp. MN12]|uniref:chromate transporter n=1 Tax=Acinetobacter sp. MN12 TaxID=1513354 RepID=UPI00051C655C
MEQEQAAAPDEPAQPIHFWQAFLFWLKLGFISFGGPAGQIAVMHQELVEQKRWISEKRFLHALNYCMLLPGPEAQQLATYIGWLMHRTIGGIVAGVLFVLPSLFILIALSWVYVKFGDVPIIAGLFYGIKPAVVAIVFHATYRIGSRSLKNKFLWAIAALAFVAIFFFNLPFPLIVLSAAIIGYLASKKYPSFFTGGSSHQQGKKDYGPALIDDDTPTPEHAIFSWKHLGKILFIGAILWFTPIIGLTLTLGWEHAYTQMAWFFTKAALLTFGGAYAVLPYVYQGAVNFYGWLSPTQMIDGLALGEST